MKPSTYYLIAFAITAVVAGFSASTHKPGSPDTANERLWLKRAVGVPMLVLAAVYGYWCYQRHAGVFEGYSGTPIIRGIGWALLGMALTSRIQVDDATALQRISTSWSNQHRSLNLWMGGLIIAIHSGHIVYDRGAASLRADIDYIEICVRHLVG